MAHPRIVSREEWLAARTALLAEEKEFTRRRDALNAKRRRLPMVAIDKDYAFEGPGGKVSLLDLFDGRRQLIVYHFMFEPDAAEGCPGCSHVADNIPHLAHLQARDTSFVLVSRARRAEIAPFKARMGWTLPWYSSFGSDFNYDFHVTLNEAEGSVEWNYATAATLQQAGKIPYIKGELPGLSAFLREGDRIFHTYSTYARGLEALLNTCNLLDLTAFGRQEVWEDSPAGWPKSAQFWVRHHDRYGDRREDQDACCRSAKD
jgi:predicted dithiol-disulfide oxidoreductase (DUF899 family)